MRREAALELAYRAAVAGGFGLLVGNYLAWGRGVADYLDVAAAVVAAAAMLALMELLGPER